MKAIETRLFRRSSRFAVGVRWSDGSEEIHPVRWHSLAGAQAAADRLKLEGMRGWRAML